MRVNNDSIGFQVSRIPAVNVATVPQRSPLRYPGGKTWLIPHIREWLGITRPEVLLEPFVGGGVVSLTAVMEGLSPSAVMVELDHDVAAFWRSVLEDGAGLRARIARFDPTIDSVKSIERSRPRSVVNRGFRTLVLNRTRRDGVLARGASFCREGENGRGILSRWYPETLCRRLTEIEKYAQRLSFVEGDAMELLPALLERWGSDAAVFLDPPYTAKGGKRAGSRLYEHFNIDHAGLFKMLADFGSNFLMTYDHAPEIVDLVHKYSFHAAAVSMKNGHHNYMREIVITSQPLFA